MKKLKTKNRWVNFLFKTGILQLMGEMPNREEFIDSTYGEVLITPYIPPNYETCPTPFLQYEAECAGKPPIFRNKRRYQEDLPEFSEERRYLMGTIGLKQSLLEIAQSRKNELECTYERKARVIDDYIKIA